MTIYISQADYDAQAQHLASDPTASYGARDIRNSDVQVGSYPTSGSGGSSSGSSSSGGSIGGSSSYAYRNPQTGFLGTMNDYQRQQAIDVAKSQGFGDISSQFSLLDVPSFQNALRIGADVNLAANVGTGITPISQIPSLIPDPTPRFVTGADFSPQAGTYDKNFANTLKAFGYDDNTIKNNQVSDNYYNPYGLTGFAAEYIAALDNGATPEEAKTLADYAAGLGLSNYYDREKPEESFTTVNELLKGSLIPSRESRPETVAERVAASRSRSLDDDYLPDARESNYAYDPTKPSIGVRSSLPNSHMVDQSNIDEELMAVGIDPSTIPDYMKADIIARYLAKMGVR
jgi:hypothetical protein